MLFHVVSISTLLVTTSLILESQVYASVSGYISPTETSRLINVLKKALTADGEDVSSIYYGAAGLKLLQNQIDQSTVGDNCARLKKNFKQDNAEIVYQAVSAWAALGCPGNLHTQETIKILKTAAQNEKSTIPEVRFALEALKSLAQTVPDPNKIAKNLQTKLKEDDSVQNLGQTMHAAYHLGAPAKFALDRIEDIVVQADEIDGKMLQWEGGLTTTSLIITGVLKLPGAKPFTQPQADKIATYLLTRKTVQTARGAVALIEAVNAFYNSEVTPVSISIVGAPYVTTDKPELKVRVSDLFGRSLKTTPAPVVAQSATRVNDDVVVLSKQPLTLTGVQSEFVLPLRLEPGLYKIVIAAGVHSATLNVRVLGAVSLSTLEIGLSDNDGSGSRLVKLVNPAKLSAPLQADASQRLIVKFPLSRLVHQAFLRLYDESGKEIIFVAEPDSSKTTYKVDVSLVSELTTGGAFEIELIIGDSTVSNPVRWNLGVVTVNNLTPQNVLNKLDNKTPKPEIEHLFRKAEKRPSDLISLAFTGFTLSPLLLLLVLWLKVGINVGNVSLSSLLFQGGFGAILVLYAFFWWKLDMFTTCAWLILIGGFTFLAGQRALSRIAATKKLLKAEK